MGDRSGRLYTAVEQLIIIDRPRMSSFLTIQFRGVGKSIGVRGKLCGLGKKSLVRHGFRDKSRSLLPL